MRILGYYRLFGTTALLATVVFAVTIAPLIYLVIRSFGGAGSLADVLSSISTLQVLGRTMLLIVAVTLTSVALSVPLVWLTTSTNLRFRNVVSALLVLPLALPSFVVALTFTELYSPRGFLRDWLGVESLPSVYGFWGAWLVLVFLTYPYAYIFVRAAFLRLDPALTEAARSIGQGRLKSFVNTTLPLLKPAFISSGVLVALYVLSDFGAVTQLRYDTFTTIIYQRYTGSINLSLGAGLAVVLSVFALLIVLAERQNRPRSYHKISASAVRKVRLVSLGWWQVPILVAVALFVLFGFASHVGVLIFWLVRGLIAGNSIVSVVEPTLNSLGVSLLAALIAVCCALPVAMLTATKTNWYANLIRRLMFANFGLPSIVVAIALVFLGINLLGFIYQTVWLLVAGYALVFISIPVAVLRNALLQLNPHLEEAAASLGRRQWRRTLFVVIPLIMPSVLAGALMVFLFTMKELPIALVLSPAGYPTLAQTIWASASEGFFTITAIACLILVAVGLPFAYLVSRNSRGLN